MRTPVAGSRTKMKTKTFKKLSAIIVSAFVFGLANVGAFADDTAASSNKPKPERPARPEPKNQGGKPDVNELKDIIKNFQAQKKEYLSEQKNARAEQRANVREVLASNASAVSEAVHEAKESIVEARGRAREQARKLADEAREAAKEARKRD